VQPPPRKRYWVHAADMPSVAARPVYTCRVQAMRQAAAGRCVKSLPWKNAPAFSAARLACPSLAGRGADGLLAAVGSSNIPYTGSVSREPVTELWQLQLTIFRLVAPSMGSLYSRDRGPLFQSSVVTASGCSSMLMIPARFCFEMYITAPYRSARAIGVGGGEDGAQVGAREDHRLRPRRAAKSGVNQPARLVINLHAGAAATDAA